MAVSPKSTPKASHLNGVSQIPKTPNLSFPTHDLAMANLSTSNSISDDLAHSLSRLEIDSSVPDASIEPPFTPLSGKFYPRSSRSPASSTSGKASASPLHNVTSKSIRRSPSMHFINESTQVGKSRTQEDTIPPLPRYTPESIAANYFKTELEQHHSLDNLSLASNIVVILHDSCYGHRFSRPRTSKAALSTIVERPERLHASILGISIAYVRLGDRYSGGRYPLLPDIDPATIPQIPFRIHKTSRKVALSSNTVTNIHGTRWMSELKTMCDDAEAKLALNGKELVRPELNRGPDQEAPKNLHEGDLYLCSESLNAIEGALGAVCEGVDAVFEGAKSEKGPRRTFVSIRPPGHHCSASYPSGFCWVNNIHVGISHASLAHGLTHAAIIDFDLHHGDGSQAIAWENNKRAANISKNALPWKKVSIGYFSLHDINSYPCEMGDEEKIKNASLCIENSHGQSIWNVHLQSWKTEAEFWHLYETKYAVILEKARNYLRVQTDRLRNNSNGVKPKAAIFLSAGFDASEWESSGMQRHKVNVPTEFYARLTSDIVKLAEEEGTSVEGRIVSVLEGGYSDRALCSGILSHLSGMATEISGTTNGISNDINKNNSNRTIINRKYDPNWWSSPCFDELEALQNPPVPTESKRQKECAPTFSSPTQSFISKINTPVVRRASSGKLNFATQSPRSSTPVPRGPAPEVYWTVAAHELSKFLIPTERQTMSCTHENLSAEAMRKKLARARKEDQSNTLPNTTLETTETKGRMALRTRKSLKIADSFGEREIKRPASRVHQRKIFPAPVKPNDETTSPIPKSNPTQRNCQDLCKPITTYSTEKLGFKNSTLATVSCITDSSSCEIKSSKTSQPKSPLKPFGQDISPVV